MRISLKPSLRKFIFIGSISLLAIADFGLSLRQFAASYLASKPTFAHLQRAIFLEPGDARYHEELGRLYAVNGDWNSALKAYESAVELNPHKASAWFDLAAQFQISGNLPEQQKTLERAIQADPRTPNTAWEAANFYLSQGEIDKSFHEFRLAIEGDPTKADAALRLCLRVSPDVNTIVHQVLPPSATAYVALLSLLESRHDTAGTLMVWPALLELQQHFEIRYLFEYIQYLLLQREVSAAEAAWKDAASSFGLFAYQRASENLVVNPDFSAEVLNAPFDWQYQRIPGVALNLDSTDFHSGRRSLAIAFVGPGVSGAGIGQVVPVKPATTYDFTGFYKAPDIQGAGGPHFSVQDAYGGQTLFLSEELKNYDYWHQTGGSFTTGADSKLVRLSIVRVPDGAAIRGKLLVGNFRLTEKK